MNINIVKDVKEDLPGRRVFGTVFQMDMDICFVQNVIKILMNGGTIVIT